MAMIIDFKAGGPRIGGGGPRTFSGGSAEIVLFPGVRYERATDEAAPAQKVSSRGGRKKRDKLELED